MLASSRLGRSAFPTLSSLGCCVHFQSLKISPGTSSPLAGAVPLPPLRKAPHLCVFLPCPCLAPSAPVINPQAPNSATGSSVRVCWSLYSDDTVESYQLSYRPVRDSAPGKDQAGEARALQRLRALRGRALPSEQSEGRGGSGLRIQLLGAVVI